MESNFNNYLRFFYIIIVCVGTLYIFFKRRKLDFVSIYFFSSVLYFFPVLLGKFQAFVFTETSFYYEPNEIFYKVYIILILNSIFCIIWMIGKDSISGGFIEIPEEQLNDYQSLLILICNVLILIINTFLIYRLKQYIFTPNFDKTILLENTSILDTFALNATYFLFVVSFCFSMRWSKTIKLLSLMMLVYPFLLAKRSEIVLGIIAIAYTWISKIKYDSLWDLLKKKKKIILIGSIFFITVFLSKEILNYAAQGDWKTVLNYLTKDGVLWESIIYSEPNVITSNLNEIVRLAIDAEGDSYRFAMLGFVPFIGTLSNSILVPEEFYTIYQPIVYPDLKGWGAGNCFLGEAYSNGGWVLLLCVIILLCSVLSFLERYIYKGKNQFMKASCLAIMPYLAFYIHRNTFYFSIREMRSLIVLGILFNLINLFININKS